jgi:2'-5' RNA ligase
MIRLFTAIELPEAVRFRLSLLQAGVPGARWTPTDNLHLTLRFIGDVDEAQARDIDGVLAAISVPAFPLNLKGVGEFGHKESRALWAGVQASEVLLRLVSKIESALQRMGCAPETRKFAPHVTLARLKDAPMSKIREFLGAHSLFDSGPFTVREFALFSSRTTPKGSLYRVESLYPLAA